MDSAPPATTRDKLIGAAFTIVAREGLEAASVKTIAAEAGVTPGLLHYHFPNKEKLLEAALRQALAAYQEASRARRLAATPAEQIPQLLHAAQDAMTKDADIFRVRLAFAARALTDPALAAILRDINHAAIAETALVLAAARGAPTASHTDLNTAATVKAAFDGIILAWLIDPGFPLEAASALMETALRQRS